MEILFGLPILLSAYLLGLYKRDTHFLYQGLLFLLGCAIYTFIILVTSDYEFSNRGKPTGFGAVISFSILAHILLKVIMDGNRDNKKRLEQIENEQIEQEKAKQKKINQEYQLEKQKLQDEKQKLQAEKEHKARQEKEEEEQRYIAEQREKRVIENKALETLSNLSKKLDDL